MRLTAIASREGDQCFAQRTNHDDSIIQLALLHEDTDKLWSINVSPDGQITMTYGHITTRPGEGDLWLLGNISGDGILNIHEPTRISPDHPSVKGQ